MIIDRSTETPTITLKIFSFNGCLFLIYFISSSLVKFLLWVKFKRGSIKFGTSI